MPTIDMAELFVVNCIHSQRSFVLGLKKGSGFKGEKRKKKRKNDVMYFAKYILRRRQSVNVV